MKFCSVLNGVVWIVSRLFISWKLFAKTFFIEFLEYRITSKPLHFLGPVEEKIPMIRWPFGFISFDAIFAYLFVSSCVVRKWNVALSCQTSNLFDAPKSRILLTIQFILRALLPILFLPLSIALEDMSRTVISLKPRQSSLSAR